MYDFITEVPVVKIFSEKNILQIDSNWSEIVRNTKLPTATAAAAAADKFCR